MFETEPCSGTNSAGHTLDRLLLLQQVISPAAIEEILEDTGCENYRSCTLNFEVTFWLVLAMGIMTTLPMRAIFKACVSLHNVIATPARSSICEARQRLGIRPLRRLFYRIVKHLARNNTPGCYYRGFHLTAIDSTCMTVPDSAANDRAFGRCIAGKYGNSAFPQIRKTSLIEVGTHAELAFAVRGINAKGGEQGVVPSLCKFLNSSMLVLLDCGFYSFYLWTKLCATKAQVLMRLGSSLKLSVLRVLPDGSFLSKISPGGKLSTRNETGVDVRVIVYTHNDPRRVGCGVEHRLLTTLLDAEKYPAKELIQLYHERWEIELVFDEQKTHQAPKMSGKEAQLRSETPAGVIQELYALSLGHYVTRYFMAKAAETEKLDPDRLSFVGCLRVIQTRLAEFARASQSEWPNLYANFLSLLVDEKNPTRRNRINPRVIKVRASRFCRKRAEHRNVPKLTQAFADCVVIC